ncbi:MAG: hypothetical protein HZB38_12830 [Planctomycetes bacterium]|nr:hypothetical protein [Planctomycetota bacterium]
MTRNANNSTWKMARTALAVCGLLIGGLSSVGFDEQTLAPADEQLTMPNAQATLGAAVEKADTRSLIWHPRR